MLQVPSLTSMELEIVPPVMSQVPKNLTKMGLEMVPPVILQVPLLTSIALWTLAPLRERMPDPPTPISTPDVIVVFELIVILSSSPAAIVHPA